jgi:hypothetical protein
VGVKDERQSTFAKAPVVKESKKIKVGLKTKVGVKTKDKSKKIKVNSRLI